MILVTNNERVLKDETITCSKKFLTGSYREVLTYVRDQIHKGHSLLSHPLSGSVKPNETPYKSILISDKRGELDFDSLEMIENSIIIYDNFMRNSNKYGYNIQENLLEDFREIDFSLIVSAFKSLVV